MNKKNLLSRAEMRNVMGGNVPVGNGRLTCIITHTLSDGKVEHPTIEVDNESDAQAWCDNWLNSPDDPSLSCTYVCN